MKRIYKYPLGIVDEQVVRMPRGAVPLCVQTQEGAPCLWAMVDDEQPPQARTFRVIGTGHAIPEADGLAYVSTFQMHGGNLVFHVFEVTRL